jgi:molybdate transport system substrate-binding protein
MYPVAVLKESTQPQLAGQFEAFLFTPGAQAVLERYGFGKP